MQFRVSLKYTCVLGGDDDLPVYVAMKLSGSGASEKTTGATWWTA